MPNTGDHQLVTGAPAVGDELVVDLRSWLKKEVSLPAKTKVKAKKLDAD